MFSLVGLLTSQSQAFVTPADILLSNGEFPQGEINLYGHDTSAQLVLTADHAKTETALLEMNVDPNQENCFCLIQ